MITAQPTLTCSKFHTFSSDLASVQVSLFRLWFACKSTTVTVLFLDPVHIIGRRLDLPKWLKIAKHFMLRTFTKYPHQQLIKNRQTDRTVGQAESAAERKKCHFKAGQGIRWLPQNKNDINICKVKVLYIFFSPGVLEGGGTTKWQVF